MNRHNFLQFNPNCYKKLLTPFGCNVLETLIKHWRTGFDNNESRRRQHFCSYQNKRNTSYPRSIPSVPSSPARDAPDDRGIHQATNFDSCNYLIPEAEVQLDQGHPSTISVGQDDYGKDAYHIFSNDNFAMPRLPAGRPSDPSKSKSTYNEKYLCQAKPIAKSNNLLQQYKACDEMQDFSDALPNIPIKQMSRADTDNELSNEAVLTSGDLAKTVEIPNTNEEEILTTNDIITPVININNINNNLLSSTKKHTDKIRDSTMPAKIFLEILNKKTNEVQYPARDEAISHREDGVTENVDWDDMFDTELFPDPPELTQPLESIRENNFKVEIARDRKSKQNKISNKVTKPKTQIKSKKTMSKIIKNITCEPRSPGAIGLENIPKKNLRKEKYTKAVKNWLDGVDSSNPTEDDMHVSNNRTRDVTRTEIPIKQDNNVEKSYLEYKNNVLSKDKVVEFDIKPTETTTKKASESQIRTEVNDKRELTINDNKDRNESKAMIHNETVIVKHSTAIVIDKKPKMKTKKTVQTRLAEKDGKMKFGPPIIGQSESTIKPLEDKEVKIKENKAKVKFVPPIKSQIPVKNVTFDVSAIDESNVHLLYDMINSEDDDITMVLIYSNGFCQLNNHFTEETCVPEGIMIQSHEKFFYLKNNEQNSGLMRRILEKSHVICYNGKRLLIYLISKYDLELKQDLFNFSDAKIGASLIDPDNSPENFAELQKLLGFIPEYTIATECMLQKAAWYTTLLTECFDKLKSMLIENSVWNVFGEIEMPLLPVIAGMEYQGVSVDLEKIKSMEDILLTKMQAVEQECYKAAGKTFQINSTVQVRTILYDELQLDRKSNLKIKETIGKGAKSTSESMLRGLVSVHPLPRLILEYRHLHKAHATFLTGIAQHVKDGTVRPTWVQMAAATGRIASNNPNLQAIPKAPFSLVVFPEKSDQQEPTLNFRSVYTARPLHSFLAADFKHIECRVFAHAAEDATLQDALRSGQDLFRVLAAKWLNKPVGDVSTEDRERTKRIVYASLYGAGARKLMEILQVGYDQALNVMTSFNRTFPALKSFGRAVVARASRGELRSLCGRARRFPHIASADAGLRAQAERQAVNFVVQGSAADLCKRAMVCVQRRLSPTALRCRLLLQIHDELVWEVADGDLNPVAMIIKEAMENVGRECGMGITLPVELTHGRNWGEMQPFSSPDL